MELAVSGTLDHRNQQKLQRGSEPSQWVWVGGMAPDKQIATVQTRNRGRSPAVLARPSWGAIGKAVPMTSRQAAF